MLSSEPMSMYIDEIKDLCVSRLYRDPFGIDLCSLTTRVHSIAVKVSLLCLKGQNLYPEKSDYEYEWIREEKSYCDYPETSDEFWEYVMQENVFGEEIDEENLPSVQTEEDLIATCFAYILSIPNWEDRDDFFIYPFVQEIIQRVQQDKGESLESLGASLVDRGIRIPHRKIQDEKLYVSERKNEILRLIALNRELFSEENRWILYTTEQIVRSYWEVMHKFRLQRIISDCLSKAFAQVNSTTEVDRAVRPLFLKRSLEVKAVYDLQGDWEAQVKTVTFDF